MHPSLVLVGPPGAGKSTVGKVVAGKRGEDFTDTDALVEASAGRSVAEVFFDEGEQGFRTREAEAVAAALERSGVVALGGGAVLEPETRRLLVASTARVVHLSVGVPDAARRVGLARDRPVLTVNPRAALHALLEERAPLYAEVADVVIATDGRPVREVVDAVLEVLDP